MLAYHCSAREHGTSRSLLRVVRGEKKRAEVDNTSGPVFLALCLSVLCMSAFLPATPPLPLPQQTLDPNPHYSSSGRLQTLPPNPLPPPSADPSPTPDTPPLLLLVRNLAHRLGKTARCLGPDEWLRSLKLWKRQQCIRVYVVVGRIQRPALITISLYAGPTSSSANSYGAGGAGPRKRILRVT